ncbi:HTH domain-containing protein [Sporolactobacillus terrae]|uniref:HTH domain-containing protein n=1 Tax=Sporolactobacillus terrae TaxID=269673 RepID=A0ABX5QBN3_9BACL|nr:HTH domain-containing protein [Sporolactobacillus terrae]QAA27041.1 HTH domain-containing protein [Sporolactobacillus terrae]
MYQEERLVTILDVLQKKHSLSVADLCALLHVSRDTARRDIVKLTEQGAAIRTHGGIALPDLKKRILAYRERMKAYSQEKMLIGKKALSFLAPNGTYFLNASTTISCMAKQMHDSVSIFTHSLDVADLLSEDEQSSVYLFGGSFQLRNRFFFSVDSIKQIERLHFDAAFLGAAALGTDGIYYEDEEDAWISRTVSERSDRTLILADHKKCEQMSRFKAFDWDAVDQFITDCKPPEKIDAACKMQGAELILIDSDS